MKRSHLPSASLSANDVERVQKELTLGFLNLSEGFFSQAQMNFEIVLQIDKACADAHWGLMLAKFQIKNEDELSTNPVQFKEVTDSLECKNALELADENLKNIYFSLLENINKINEGENY